MPRALPSAAEAARILGERRTRPAPRPPPPAGKSLAKVLKPLEARFGQGSQALHHRWREIVGDTLARVTEPVKLTRGRGGAGGVLELRVDGPAAALVQHQQEDILARVNLILGSGAAAKMRIVQGPVRGVRDPDRPAQRRRTLPPLDAAAEADLARSLEAADAKLRPALERLGRAVLRGR